MRVGSNKRPGFTIVELLIVVVVIAILAAITTVAYNGIQNRVRATAMQSDLNQAMKAVLVFKTTDASENYPTSLDQAGAKSSGNVTLQYSVDNNANPKTFCITATDASLIGTSYYISDTVTSPTTGKCPTHSSNPENPNVIANSDMELSSGSVVVRENLVRNPRGNASVGDNDRLWMAPLGTQERTLGVSYAGRSDWTRLRRISNTSNDIFRTHVELSELVNNQPYVISFLVANDESTNVTFYSDWNDTLDNAHTLAPGEIKRFSYTSVRATYDSTYRFFDIAQIPLNRSILITEGQIVAATGNAVADSTYFDGSTPTSGDFSYSWTGTQNSSKSQQRALGVASWNVNTNSLRTGAMYQTANGKNGKGIALEKRDGYAFAVAPANGLKPNTAYTLSADVLSPVTSVQITERTYSFSPQSKTVIANQWNRIQRTMTSNSSGSISFDIGYENAMAPSGTLLIIDNVMLVEGNYSGPYYD